MHVHGLRGSHAGIDAGWSRRRRGAASGLRRFALPVLAAAIVLSAAVAAAPALAAPETPRTSGASGVTAAGATLHGLLNPNEANEAGTFLFQYSASASSCEVGPQETAILADEGHKEEAVATTVENLLPGTSYTYCLDAGNSEGGERAVGSAVSFTTLTTAPTISEQAATEISASSAVAAAKIAPGGLSTAYHAEYVSESQFEVSGWTGASQVPSSDADLPATGETLPVSQELSGLLAGTEYRFRFAAANSKGPVAGQDVVFTTTAAGVLSAGLPDGRAYELVSALDSGEIYVPPTPLRIPSSQRTALPFQAAANGEALSYVAEPGAVGGTGETGPGEGNQWLAARSGGGWDAEDITPPATTETVYQAFSSNLTTALLEGGLQPLAPEVAVKCRALYSLTSGGLSPFFTDGRVSGECGHPMFAGASQDGAQMVFQSEAALTGDALASPEVPTNHEELHRAAEQRGEGCMFGCNLYLASGGSLSLVSEIEGHAVAGNIGGYPSGERELTNLSGAVSGDGSRIFWTDTEAGPNLDHVFALENHTTNVQVSGAGAAEYWGSSGEGRYALYTEAGGLWRFDTSDQTRLQITAEGAGVLGVIGVNQIGEGGAYVYFVATGALPATANHAGEAPTEGEPNLYLWHAGETRFIATLSAQDAKLEAATEFAGVWTANVGERLAEATPGGEQLVFESVRPLTHYDNEFEGTAAPEVFVYSAADESLICASCTPSGEAPRFAEFRRSKLPESGESNTYMRRWISQDGSRVFFDSGQPLVAADTNGVQDVYEWEREGAGTCPEQSPASVNGGCIFLLSGGTSQSNSFLIDADSNGENVFFEHVGPMGQADAPVDHNEIFDARVGGGIAPAGPACQGGSCESASVPQPPVFAPPASISVAGSGNFPPASPPGLTPKPKPKPLTRPQLLAKALKACKKKPQRQRAGCERQARKRYGAKRPAAAKHPSKERKGKVSK
jgi:hypothetical protein